VIAQQHVEILAHHGLLLAIPAFVPAIAVVGVIVFVVIRDRRRPREGADSASSARSKESE
jgi:hypothetical protein